MVLTRSEASTSHGTCRLLPSFLFTRFDILLCRPTHSAERHHIKILPGHPGKLNNVVTRPGRSCYKRTMSLGNRRKSRIVYRGRSQAQHLGWGGNQTRYVTAQRVCRTGPVASNPGPLGRAGRACPLAGKLVHASDRYAHRVGNGENGGDRLVIGRIIYGGAAPAVARARPAR